jgi:hypothetical protein
VVRARGIWHDDDVGWSGGFPLEPSIVWMTSRDMGKLQRLWLCDELSIEDQAAAMDRMVVSFASDPGARGAARLLRLSGFFHRKRHSQLVEICGRQWSPV